MKLYIHQTDHGPIVCESARAAKAAVYEYYNVDPVAEAATWQSIDNQLVLSVRYRMVLARVYIEEVG